MRKLNLCFLFAVLAASTVFAQFKSEPAGAPPAELAPAISQALEQQGTKIVGSSGVFCEVWFRTSLPAGPKSAEESVTLPTIPLGALVGAIRFPAQGADRRGQPIKPGVYTLRYGLQPLNGDHLGVSPQRDFLVLVPAGDDKDLNAAPNFDALMAMSRKASGTPHPAVLSMWGAGASDAAGFAKQGENDWVLTKKIGDTLISVILVGKVEG
ncbi:MAG: hypothetical protein DMG58_17300 [Acidobacteria bacterium]|nr:MAG: hypothetical protein DMG58_17300 [Acidobacteriota bacterium]